MVTDQQARRLFQMSQDSKLNKSQAAIKSGMDEKTARKYLNSGKLPSELKADRSWRTHNDAFRSVWDELRNKLEVNPGLVENPETTGHRFRKVSDTFEVLTGIIFKTLLAIS